MAESHHNAIILKKANQARLNSIISNFGKADQNSLRFSELFQLLIDRCIVNNKVPFSILSKYFNDAVSESAKVKKQELLSSSESYLSKQQLIYMINEVGKFIFHGDKNYQDKIYNQLLAQKTIAKKGVIEHPRIMIMDELNKKQLLIIRLLSQPSIKTFNDYENQMQNLFLIYTSENYFSIKKHSRLLLSWRQIVMQNKKLTSPGFVRFLKQAEIVPHLISIEHIQQFMSRVIPSVTTQEKQFQFGHSLVQIYNKPDSVQKIPSAPNTIPEPVYKGDPGILFFQFQVMIGRIAWEVFPKDTEKKSVDFVLKRFFQQNLLIRQNEMMKMKSLPNINRKCINHLKQFYDKYQKSSQDRQMKKVQDAFDEDLKDPLQLLAQKQSQQIFNADYSNIDISQMYKVLDKQLPPLPPQPKVQKQYPPPYKVNQKTKKQELEKVIIGMQPPPPPVQKNAKQQAKPSKKKQGKAGQPQPRQFKFQSMPGPPPERSQDIFQKLADDLQYEAKNLTSIQRGVMSDIEVIPCIIQEILYPPEVPIKVKPLIEAAINSHNQQNFILALENYNKARKVWKQVIGEKDLPASIQLYFQFSKGSVFNSAGRDDHALMHFYLCRNWAQTSKINYVNPDRALPYCGLGSILYNMQQYQFGLRSFLKARQIREGLLGIESVDTATTFNNLGCCMFMLQRNKQALSYFKIAQAVFNCELGPFHERSGTATRNISKCNKGFFNNIPEYKKLWQAFQKDPFGGKKKKGKKKK